MDLDLSFLGLMELGISNMSEKSKIVYFGSLFMEVELGFCVHQR
jgi:hypothetical protein